MKILIMIYILYNNDLYLLLNNQYLFIGSSYGRAKRKRWNENEKTVVLTTFDENIKSGKLPSLRAIHEVIRQNPCLRHRTFPQVKSWLQNQLKRIKSSKSN